MSEIRSKKSEIRSIKMIGDIVTVTVFSNQKSKTPNQEV